MLRITLFGIILTVITGKELLYGIFSIRPILFNRVLFDDQPAEYAGRNTICDNEMILRSRLWMVLKTEKKP
jgi:hypothetical protein